MLNRLIARFYLVVRGERFAIDPQVPWTYLLSTLAHKGIDRLRGVLKLRRIGRGIFVERGATIRAHHLIRLRGYARFGKDCHVDALSRDGISAGHGLSVGRGVSIECTGSLKSIGKGLLIGENVGIGSHSFLGCAGGVSIGSNTIFGNSVSLHSENHVFTDPRRPIRAQGVTRLGIEIGSDCWLGAKVTILDGARIAEGTIVAAGAVVLAGEYPPRSILGGVPAKVLGLRG
ncbi:acyltransferase [Sphingorhabdus sp.]|uniref:acyltransferase n=1 Tax=Sphingorhabdus sp. TaxID=1902408 RepID=UPI003FA79DAF